jgi:class 3 adenylate cyclase
MGTIWVALDSQLQRRVALKLMTPGRLASPVARAQFEQEARAVAQLQHPNVVQVHDYGVDEDTPYLVMELLEGEDLETRLERQERMTPAALAALLNQVARALSAAHAAGIVHRDLKPANLFLARVDAQEVVKVLDFGLARLEAGGESTDEPGKVMGTPRYMSPEQMRGEATIDHRSDLWSLGVLAYRALTGCYPFSAESLGELLERSTRLPAEPPSRVLPELGTGLDAFFTRALEPELSRRFASALELASAFAAQVESGRPARAVKVLIVDDEPSVEVLMRQRFRKQIRDASHQLVFARDGMDALEKLREHPDTDVVLSDINMPRMDGLTFLARVGEVNPLVKVIIVSAYGDMGNIRVAMNRGAFDFLVKPFDFEDLQATLNKALKQVAELREMVHSAKENELLRMFVHGGILERALPALRGPGGVAGEKAEATVAFLDVKDFTAVAREGRPEAALQRLNANFEVLVPELTRRGGMVDKFVGDAVMAVFRGPGHLEQGVEACLAARRQLEAMAARHGEQSPYAHGVCIGLDSGELLCGSVGAPGLGRLDYTVIGDAVNTAARLASLAGRQQLLVTDALRQRLDKRFESVRLGARTLSGVGAAVLIHDVQGQREETVSGSDETSSVEAEAARRTPPTLSLGARVR